MNNFSQLHIHTEYSYLDGLCHVESLVKRAKDLSMHALGITDHATINGALEFQEVCNRYEVNPIIGCECYIVENMDIKLKEEFRQHIVFFVMNKMGWINLNKILTKANISGFYFKPRIDYDFVLKNADGLLIATACANSFLNIKAGREFFERLLNEYKDNVYVELMPLDFEKQYQYHKKLMLLHKKISGLKYLSTNDCHYLMKEDYKIHDIMLAINTNSKISDEKRWKFEVNELYLKSYEEMIDSFKKQDIIPSLLYEQGLFNTQEIVEKCKSFSLKQKNIYLPKVIKEDEYEYIKNICKKRQLELGHSNSLKYVQRLDEELDVLKELNFLRYFLIVFELVNWCKEQNILIGAGRGSVSSSYIAYLLGITKINPFDYDLIFERFIDKTRKTYPDIDIDFEDTKRELIRKHLEDLYGKYNVASLSTYMRMKDRMVFRDVCRVYEIPLEKVNKISRFLEENLNQFFEETYDGSNFAMKYPEIVEACYKLKGQIRNQGQHAAGLVIANHDLRRGDFGNLVKAGNSYAINWTKENVMFFGLLKLDILGLSTLSIIRKALDFIKNNNNQDIDLVKINLEDKKIFDKFTKGDSVGCFQFSSYGMRKLCNEVKIDNFNSLVDVIALFRPAPLRFGLTELYVTRKITGNYPKITEDLYEILKSTNGIIIYQEQIMQIANKVANLPLTVANDLRIALDHQDEKVLNEIHSKFIEGCIKKGHTMRQAEKIWSFVNKYREYGFCKAHAVGYALIAYYTMYLKVYYPEAFFSSALTHIGKDKKEELLSDAIKFKLKISIPKISISKASDWVYYKRILYMPFIEVKGIGEKMAIILEGIGCDNENFFTNGKGIGVKTIEILKNSGILGGDNIDLKKYYDYNRILLNKFQI